MARPIFLKIIFLSFMNNYFSDAKQKQDKLKAELYERRKLALAAVSVILKSSCANIKGSLFKYTNFLTARADERNSLKNHRTRRCKRLDYHQSHLW